MALSFFKPNLVFEQDQLQCMIHSYKMQTLGKGTIAALKCISVTVGRMPRAVKHSHSAAEIAVNSTCSGFLTAVLSLSQDMINQGLFCHDQVSLGKFLAFFNL